jgi:hypothetical protein
MAYAGLVTALSAALLYLLAVLPTLRLAILFVLSLLPVTLAHEKRYGEALLSFAAASLLSGLLFPASGLWLMYVAFFGWYGIAREYVVNKLNRVLSWFVLAAMFNASFFALYITSAHLFTGFTVPEFLGKIPLPVLLIPAAEIAFVLFELLFGMCREYYIRHIRKLLYRQD